MKYYQNLLGVLLPFLIAGCTTADIKGVMDSLNNAGKPVSSSPNQPAAQPVTNTDRTSLLRTPLHNALSRNLSTDGRAPEWPKVVIINLQIPDDQLSPTTLYPKANDCIWFDAVLWHDAKRSERFTHVSLCGSELPSGVPNDFVRLYFSEPVPGKTTGQLRTDGPTPPFLSRPSSQVLQQWMTSGRFGTYFMGSLMRLVGYDPDFPIDGRRFWIKNIK